MAEATYRIAFDIGGTFTDFALLNEQTGELAVHKTLTTPHDPAEGAVQGVSEILARAGVPADRVRHAIHGTTWVANALIERRGSKVALLTTQGFRDVLEIGDALRYDIYDLLIRLAEPLVPRYLRLGVEERIDAGGRVLQPLDRESVAQALAWLRAEDARDQAVAPARRAALGIADGTITSLAVCFLHAYGNPENEQRAARIVAELWPDLDVSLSSAVAPEIREYERASTTVANAYVRPSTRRYLQRLAQALRQLGYQHRLSIMLSSAGICSLEAAADYPIRIVESGPAGGAVGAAFYGRLCDIDNLVSFDMGGTTAKICLIRNGQPAITHALEVARVHRFKKGSGLPLQVASVDLMEIGAGGGSIAWIDDLGLLKVGPRSASASPGPACYGRGGSEPTVTDADLVLGYLDPDYFLGGAMRLDREAAQSAIQARIAGPLGLSVMEAAWGIHQVVNEQMAAAAKMHIVERGWDPGRHALLAFGGAGPIHAYQVAHSLHQQRIICPLAAGVLSAIGFLVAPATFEFAQSRPQLLNVSDWLGINRLLADLDAQGVARLVEAGIAPEDISMAHSASARFTGQLHEIAIEIPPGTLSHESIPTIEALFLAEYRALYGHVHEGLPIELLTWRVVAAGALTRPRIQRYPDSDSVPPVPPVPRAHRLAYWGDLGHYARTPVYDRYALAPTASLAGPAIVEERESTVLVPPGSTAQVDPYLNLLINLNPVPVPATDQDEVPRGEQP